MIGGARGWNQRDSAMCGSDAANVRCSPGGVIRTFEEERESPEAVLREESEATRCARGGRNERPEPN